MRQPFTAALLSALVFPGVGQMYLQRLARGLAFLLPCGLLATYLSMGILGPVLGLAREVMAGTLSMDPLALQARLDQQGGLMTPGLALLALALAVAWLWSVIDAYRLGDQRGRGQP